MRPKPKDIDSYITMAPAYARPILAWFRQQPHAALPEILKAPKWSHPAYLREDGTLFLE